MPGLAFRNGEFITPRISDVSSDILVVLLFLHLWLAASVLGGLQVALEVILLLWLLRLSAKLRFTVAEMVLGVVFVGSMALSFAVNDIVVSLLDAKIYGLSILSLIVFHKLRVNMRMAAPILALNLGISVYQAAFGDPFFIAWLMNNVAGAFGGIVGSRPMGIFMNTHVSATLNALFLIWLGYRRKLFGLGFVAVLLNRSFFVLLAYAGQQLYNLFVRLRMQKVVIAAGLMAVMLVVLNADRILAVDLMAISDIFSEREQIAYGPIAGQILSPETYKRAFTLLPTDSKKLSGEGFAGWYGNEIGYFTVLQQGGFLLSPLFLVILLTRVSGFRIFLALTMLHYGMATTPVCIFLMMQWSRSLRLQASTALRVPRKRSFAPAWLKLIGPARPLAELPDMNLRRGSSG